MLRKAGRTLQHHRWLQAALLIGFWQRCAKVAQRFALPVPSGIIALVLLLLLLHSGILRKGWVSKGTTGLLDHMILFFVPAIMALLKHGELLGLLGLKLLAVIVASTLVVMVGTALIVELSLTWRERHAG